MSKRERDHIASFFIAAGTGAAGLAGSNLYCLATGTAEGGTLAAMANIAALCTATAGTVSIIDIPNEIKVRSAACGLASVSAIAFAAYTFDPDASQDARLPEAGTHSVSASADSNGGQGARLVRESAERAGILLPPTPHARKF